ncbi:MAG: OmpA family protein [Terriglobales bacterium]
MKSRTWIALPLAAALMAPVYAQQDTNTTQDQDPPAAIQTAPAPPSQTTAEQSTADQGMSARQPLQAERKEGFWGKLNPFARKKYVQRQMQPIRDRVNELDELTTANAKSIRDVDARATEGIRLAAARAEQADQRAAQAGTTAQQAQQTAQQASTRLQTVSAVVGSIDQFQPVTQAEIRLRPGQIVLSKRAKEALDQMAGQAKGQNGYIFEVQGFSPGRGQAAIENSNRMAQSVVRYLVLNHDIPVYRIYLLGMGNAPVQASAESGAPRRTSRGGRVEVSLLKNGVDQLNNQAATAAPTTQGGMAGTTTAQPVDQQQAPATNMQQQTTANPAAQQTPPPQQ